MSIVRLIFVTVKAEDASAAERVWKTDCAPLMIRQNGCLSEELLKSTEVPGEFISYAEWDSQASIDRYLASADHQLKVVIPFPPGGAPDLVSPARCSRPPPASTSRMSPTRASARR